MGYHSDVGLALKPSAVHILQKQINALDKNSEAFSVITDFLAYADKHYEHDTGAEIYLWEYVKWYDEFPDVGFIENLLESLDLRDFLFIRIGEELDDIEYRGSFWDNPFDLSVSRNIVVSPSVPRQSA